jgi:hypothetical protein
MSLIVRWIPQPAIRPQSIECSYPSKPFLRYGHRCEHQARVIVAISSKSVAASTRQQTLIAVNVSPNSTGNV